MGNSTRTDSSTKGLDPDVSMKMMETNQQNTNAALQSSLENNKNLTAMMKEMMGSMLGFMREYTVDKGLTTRKELETMQANTHSNNQLISNGIFANASMVNASGLQAVTESGASAYLTGLASIFGSSFRVS